jgi:two-component sensor histidine kinase
MTHTSSPVTTGNTAIIPPDEVERMQAVKRYDILDTPPDGSFERVTALAARRFNVPIAIVSVVDNDRIWFKSHHGVSIDQIGRDPGLCASAILKTEPYILENASLDPRSLANPLVAGDFGLRFYAGVPLRTSDGYNLGTLCVIDKAPRPIDQAQIDDLKDLAAIVMDQMEVRLSARQAVAKAQILAREIDHRVMNSLQFISGMLAMQSRAVDPAAATTQLKIAADRVAAVARVHRHFYAEEATENVSCITFIRRLCDDLSSILESRIFVEGDESDIPTTLIQPIGLLINELVINAAKHGAGRIDVTYRARADEHMLVVCDHGNGLPQDFNLESSNTGLGMKVIRLLTKQLRGSIAAEANPGGSGACFTITFPV